MKLTQWREEEKDRKNLYRGFLEINRTEAETLLKHLEEQLNSAPPETVTYKLNLTVTDAVGKPLRSASGLLTVGLVFTPEE